MGTPAVAPQIGHCPWWLLAVSLGVSVVGGVLALVAGTRVVLDFAAWALAGPLAFALLAVYVSRDTAARSRGTYTAPTWAPAAYWLTVAVALIAVVVTAWQIAQWAGRA